MIEKNQNNNGFEGYEVGREQVNLSTGVAYSGLNEVVLHQIKCAAGFESNKWLTFLQAKSLGLSVIKGSKGTKLVRIVDVFDSKKKENGKKPKSFTVFNENQVKKASQ